MVQSVGNDTVNGTSSWVPEPNGRGTWSLLSTCLITISLCVWSAVHLNVPQHQKTHSQYWRKVKWLFLGLFAPELVAYVAWQQWQEARKLRQDIRAVYGQDKIASGLDRIRQYLGSIRSVNTASHEPAKISPPPSPKVDRPVRSEWTLVHGFYALMGGFAFASPSGTVLPNDLTRATITPSGLRFLLELTPEALPDITADQIKDKSKADGLKKTIVCIQALWFCIQCITRVSQSLPVSLLELNTVGHALCTLVIYLLWWHKPLDVEEPTLITDPTLFPLFAYMWMSSRISASCHCTHDMPDGLQDEFHCIWPFSEPSIEDLAYPNGVAIAASGRSSRSQLLPETLSSSKAHKDSNNIDRPAYLSAMYRSQQRLHSFFVRGGIKVNVPAG